MIKFYFALDTNDELFVINCTQLENSQFLKEAHVLKRLLQIENDDFANIPLKTDEDGRILLFKDLDISKNEWMYLQNFLSHGYVPLEMMSWNEQVNAMENINFTAAKLGGVPSFDTYYHDFYERRNVPTYNPKCPEDDILNQYEWTLENSMFRSFRTMTGSWYATKHYRMGVTDFIWWRREKGQTVK